MCSCVFQIQAHVLIISGKFNIDSNNNKLKRKFIKTYLKLFENGIYVKGYIEMCVNRIH